jgi:hypothetical protein
MTFIDEMKTKINNKRTIRTSSLDAYIFNINKLYRSMYDDKQIDNINFLNNKEAVMKAIENKKLSTRKTYLAAIVVVLMAYDSEEDLIKFYRTEMEQLAKTFNIEMETQKKSQTQDENWTSLEELKKVMKSYKTQLDKDKILQKDSNTLTKKQFELLQKWVVACLYLIDDENPPMRNNYIMKVINKNYYEKLSDDVIKQNNYLVVKSRNQKFFSLGNYKTSGSYGTKVIDIGAKLNSVLNIFLKFNTTDNLLLNSKGEPMTANNLTKFIQKVFNPTGKVISSTMLRHIYITTKFPAQLLEKKEVAGLMLHSTEQQSLYSKK